MTYLYRWKFRLLIAVLTVTTAHSAPDSTHDFMRKNEPVVTSSHGQSSASCLFDGSAATRWTSGSPMQPGMWLQVAFAKPIAIDSCVFDSGKSKGDYPRGYEIYFSNDGKNWGQPVAESADGAVRVEVKGGHRKAKFIKVVQTGSHRLYWSVHELEINGLSMNNMDACPTAGATDVYLPVSAAKTKAVKVDGATAQWSRNGELKWRFQLTEPGTKYIKLTYAMNRDSSVSVSVPGQLSNKKVVLDSTGGVDTFKTVALGKLDSAPAGRYTFTLKNKDRSLRNIKGLVISSEAPAYACQEIYSKKADFAETLLAMRQALKPMVKRAATLGTDEVFMLEENDGRQLRTDFPMESDWFLQDNKVHGTWGKGTHDARGDYRAYLDPARDSTLEQQLIGTVLEEIDSPKLQTKFAALSAAETSPDDAAWLNLYLTACRERRTQRLAPLLKETDRLIYARHINLGSIYMTTETQGGPAGSQLRMIDLTPEALGQPLKDELLFDPQGGMVRDPELSFDGKKLLFAWRKTSRGYGTRGTMAPETGNYKIYEMDLATREIRQLTTDETYGADFEPCYMPNGDIMFSSARIVQEITCGWGDCSNLFLMDKDGNYARRVGFDQTQTGFPHLLNDGRVIFTRRDYNDRGQSYAHALFVMNPDGTKQTEYYGNNSMAPTSIQHTRPIPGSHKTMGIAGGYHTPQGGKLVTIDVKKGRQNYEGLTFTNWTPTPLPEVNNENFSRVGEQYSYPYPFDEQSLLVSLTPEGGYMNSPNGAIVSESGMLYKLFYMTLDGHRELLAADPTFSCMQAIPVRPRKRPSVRGSSVDYTKTNGVCYVQNVYYGPSAKGIKPGSIKKLRVIQMHYKPATIGGARWAPPRDQIGPGRKYSSYGQHSVLPVGVGTASFDAKTILGEVEVHADGSAMFEIPARTPVYFQLIDENGLVAQTMRSWTTLMPNERFSCVGCHEENDSTPLPQSTKTMAMQQAPQKIKPVALISGAAFSYAKVVQPILNQHCVSCHAPGKKGEKIDLTDTVVSDFEGERGFNSTRRKFYQSYLTLLQSKKVGKFIDEGRPNQWVDYYTRLATVELTPPYYAGSIKSGLIKKMMDGHGKTKITPNEIRAIAAWIDLNVPFIGEYDEMNIWDDTAKKYYRTKTEMRRKQEVIESDNIQRYIEAGQK